MSNEGTRRLRDGRHSELGSKTPDALIPSAAPDPSFAIRTSLLRSSSLRLYCDMTLLLGAMRYHNVDACSRNGPPRISSTTGKREIPP
jgi:hypothetical protein